MMKGCVIPVVDDKLTLLCKKNAEMASDVSLNHQRAKYSSFRSHMTLL